MPDGPKTEKRGVARAPFCVVGFLFSPLLVYSHEWWHQWPDPAITMVQYQKEGEPSNTMTIVYPDVYKTGDPIYVGN